VQKPVQTVPNTVLVCDVSHIDFSGLSGAEVDAVVGGSVPDFSIVRGSDWDMRGRLYAYFVRALTALQPKAFVFENVPGLLAQTT